MTHHIVAVLLHVVWRGDRAEVCTLHAAFRVVFDVRVLDAPHALCEHWVHVGPKFFHIDQLSVALHQLERRQGPMRLMVHAASCPK